MSKKGPEAIFQKDVIDLAHTLGWRVAHFRTSMNARGHYMTAVAADGKGFPDLCMVRRGRIVFAELKAGSNPLTAEQKAWMEDLDRASAGYSRDPRNPVDVCLWHAEKTPREEILAVLR